MLAAASLRSQQFWRALATKPVINAASPKPILRSQERLLHLSHVVGARRACEEQFNLRQQIIGSEVFRVGELEGYVKGLPNQCRYVITT